MLDYDTRDMISPDLIQDSYKLRGVTQKKKLFADQNVLCVGLLML